MTVAEAFLKSVSIDGEKVTSLYDQWIPQEIIPLAEGITCLTMVDALNGRRAVWYLDGNHNYCGSHVEVIQGLQTSEIVATVSPWFDHLSRHSLASTPSVIKDVPQIPLFLATQLSAAWSVRAFTELHQLQTALLEHDDEIARFGKRTITSRQIRRILGTRIGPETLVVLSPITGTPLRSQASFVVDHQLIHRFHDAEADCALYLSWWEKKLALPPSFYCPKANLIVSDEGMAGMLPSLILGWYLSNPDHVLRIGEAQAFEARDYGLGKASSLSIEPVDTAASLPPMPAAPSADMISESWAFLHQHQFDDEDAPVETDTSKENGHFLDRLRSLMIKK